METEKAFNLSRVSPVKPSTSTSDDSSDLHQSIAPSESRSPTLNRNTSSEQLINQQQHLQELLLSSAASLPNSVQQAAFLQQQQLQLNELFRGQQVAVQERLQLNILHRGQLSQQLQQCRDKKLMASLQVQIQNLAFEQQQLLQQLQMQSNPCLLQPISPNSDSLSADAQKLWENFLLSNSSSSLSGTLGSTAAAILTAHSIAKLPIAEFTGLQQSHALYQQGICTWPSCDQRCDSITSFMHHLNSVHLLDDRSAAQCRVQMEVVESLEVKLVKERQRLQAMIQHLQVKQNPDTLAISADNIYTDSPLISPQSATISPYLTSGSISRGISTSAAILQQQIRSTSPTETQPDSAVNSSIAPSPTSITAAAANSTTRRRVTDKSNLPITAEIERNRDFYKSHDVRPPYTYASLIRQAILDSKDCQLTLNEIYQWFTDTFAFFRRNAATWKNAVRHNLSLHKCFARVENVKGAVWTVDDSEFYRRRPQRSTANGGGTIAPKNNNNNNNTLTENTAETLAAALANTNPLALLSSAAANLPLPSNFSESMEQQLRKISMDMFIRDELENESNHSKVPEEVENSPKLVVDEEKDESVSRLNTVIA